MYTLCMGPQGGSGAGGGGAGAGPGPGAPYIKYIQGEWRGGEGVGGCGRARPNRSGAGPALNGPWNRLALKIYLDGLM